MSDDARSETVYRYQQEIAQMVRCAANERCLCRRR